MIRLVCGPPGAGKNTYVEKNKGKDDVIIDLDAIRDIAQNEQVANSIRQTLEASVATYTPDVWVIRTLAKADERTDAAKRLNAQQTIVIATPADVAKNQATKRGKDLSEPIDRWWNEYTAVDSDLVIKPDMGVRQGEKKMAKELGFPDQTPWKDMTPEEQVNYWRHQARKHEQQAKGMPKDYDELKKFYEDNQSDASRQASQKAIDAAKEEGRKEALMQTAPDRVKAAFKTHAAKVPEDILNELMVDIDPSKYLNDKFEVDDTKVKTRAEALAKPFEGSTTNHQGHRKNSAQSANSVAGGRDLFTSQNKKD